MHNLPQELIESIVDFIHDPVTLKACSLVGQSFVYIAQKNLFMEIVLSPPKPRTTTPAQSFLGVLFVSPHIGRYVQSLIINCGDSVDQQPWLYSDTAVQYILPLLAKLRKISVMGRTKAEDNRPSSKASLTWSSLSAALRSALTSVMLSGSVVDLELGGFIRLPTSSFIQCRALKKLSLLPLYLVDDAERSSTPSESIQSETNDDRPEGGTHIQLEEVTIKQTSIALTKTTEWLLHPQCDIILTKLKNLHLSISTIEDHRRVAPIIRASAPSLHRLELSPGHEIHAIRHLLKIVPPTLCTENALSLAYLNDLKSLILDTDFRTYKLNNNRFADPLPWIVNLFQTLPVTNSITNLEFIFGLHVSKRILEKVSWAELADELCSERFAGLKTVYFRFPLLSNHLSERRPAFVKEVLENDAHLSELRRKSLLQMDL